MQVQTLAHELRNGNQTRQKDDDEPQIFLGALGLNKPISDPSTAEPRASRADGHGREYLEFSFGHLDDENDVQSL